GHSRRERGVLRGGGSEAGSGTVPAGPGSAELKAELVGEALHDPRRTDGLGPLAVDRADTADAALGIDAVVRRGVELDEGSVPALALRPGAEDHAAGAVVLDAEVLRAHGISGGWRPTRRPAA